MEDRKVLVETIGVRITLWGNGAVHASLAYNDSDVTHDIHWHNRYTGDETLGDAVDDVARLLAAWAAVGSLGLASKL